MVIQNCQHDQSKKFGKDRYGNQRHRCILCGKVWNDVPAKLLGTMRLDLRVAEMVIKCLCEGNSVRATARLTNTDPHTVIDLCNTVGSACEKYMERTIKGIRVVDVQADEIWQYIYCKQATAFRNKIAGGVGDSYCFTAIERNTKLLLTWHMGRRSDMDTAQFCEKLANATSGRFHLSTDGWQPYPYWVRRFMGGRVDYGTIVKIFRDPVKEDRRRYSPPTIIGQKKTVILGEPEHSQVCTSHVERMNGSIRTFCKRMGRLTYCFSKRWGNHRAALGLLFAHYNFCRKHRSLKKRTPAMAAGLADHAWTVRELIETVMGSALESEGL